MTTLSSIDNSTDKDLSFLNTPQTFYLGIDPTAPSLHVGHLFPLMQARKLEQQGHKCIIVLGTGTAKIGDPSGRSKTRQMLSTEIIYNNAFLIEKQISKFIVNPLFLFNSKWLDSLSYLNFLRDIGQFFSVNKMLSNKTYKERLDNNDSLNFIEFNYQLLQAYDFLYLYQQHGCLLQIGGSDQWGNMIAGIDLIKRIHNTIVNCITFPLLTTASGKKMGKTENGAIWLDDNLTSPFEYFQFWRNSDDKDVYKFLKIFTDISQLQLDKGFSDINEAKNYLAFQCVKMLHGEEAATNCTALQTIKMKGQRPYRLIDIVENTNYFKSRRDIRQNILQNAIKINNIVETDPNKEFNLPLVLQIGKRLRYNVI